jgi:dihydroxyacetone kinase
MGIVELDSREVQMVGRNHRGCLENRGLTIIALLLMLERSKPTEDLAELLDRIIQVVETSMDGTSGALYTIFLNTLVQSIREQSGKDSEPAQAGIWAKALEKSLVTLNKYTPAQVGDRTLIDALYPFVSTLSRTGLPKKAAEAAVQGAEKTKGMKASLGRSVYVEDENWKVVPDPGAYGLAQFLSGLADGLG